MKEFDDGARSSAGRQFGHLDAGRHQTPVLPEWVTKIAMGVIGVGLAVPLIGYVVGPALKRRESTWNEIGPIDNLRSGEPEELRIRQYGQDGWRTASMKKVVWAIKQPTGPIVVFSPDLSSPWVRIPDGTVATKVQMSLSRQRLGRDRKGACPGGSASPGSTPFQSGRRDACG